MVRQQAADLLHRLLPGAAPGKLRAVFLQDIVPYLQLHRLVVFAVAVRRDMQPQHLLRYLVALPANAPKLPSSTASAAPAAIIMSSIRVVISTSVPVWIFRSKEALAASGILFSARKINRLVRNFFGVFPDLII